MNKKGRGEGKGGKNPVGEYQVHHQNDDRLQRRPLVPISINLCETGTAIETESNSW